ncbi:MAG: phasin family protein [Pseudomonadota bacterium]
MNPIERQMKLARELMELNTEWFRKIAEYDVQNVQKYVEMNQEFAQKLPEVRDIQSFADLQREYGETLWTNTQEVMKARGEMVREAFEANGDAWRTAFSNEEVVEAAPKAKAEKAEKAAA